MNIKCEFCGTTINPTANTHACQPIFSTGANPPPFQGSEWIVHEVHGEGGTTVNGQKLYWAKVRKLPDEQEKVQHNMKIELPR